ncbi:MAG: phosphoheptose isomerase [Bacteroidetes bacterium]|nr:phosphoheptose isomerase [Bacteroidota bacterium]
MLLKDSFDKDGKKISPTLPENVKNYLIDIDGTICDDIPNEEPERMLTAAVYPDAKELINKWYNEGHIITFFTSRLEAHRAYTEQWLKDNGFKYHGIMFGKPRGGNYHWIDDRSVKATRFFGKFTELVEKEKMIWVFED